MMNESIEMLLHAKKLRYEYLDALMKNIIKKKNTPYDSINILVDVNDMIKQLYKPDIVETINTRMSVERQDIAAELINIVSHYRHYFFSRWWKYTNFFFFYSSKRSKYHLDIDPNYRKDFYKKRLREPKSKKFLPQYETLNTTLESAIKICKTFLMYVPHAYFIDTGKVDYTLTPYILFNNIEGEKTVSGEEEPIFDKCVPTFILSNDEIYYQDLINIKSDYPIRQILTKGTKSEILDRENILDYLTKNLKKEPEYSYTESLYTALLSFMGYTKYNVEKINGMGIGRVLPFVEKNLYNKGFLYDINYTSVREFSKAIKNSDIKEEYKELAIKNFRLLSHDAMRNVAYNDTDVAKIAMDCRREIVDPKEVRRTNEKYFENNPIITEFCYDGETY